MSRKVHVLLFCMNDHRNRSPADKIADDRTGNQQTGS